MIFYGVKLFNIVQFDYYGDNIFIATIFKENGIESKYPVTDPKKYFLTEESRRWKKEDYIIQQGTMQYEQNAALFCFNGLMNVTEYYDIQITNSDVDQKFAHMVSNLYL